MLEHLNRSEVTPERVVILGSGGFVGGTAQRLLEQNGVPVLGLARRDVDLMTPNAGDTLAELLNETDSLVVVSANAPCKNAAMLLENVQMMNTVCDAITTIEPAHIIYISSDAVYHDSPSPMSEDACAAPRSAHGAMHVAREQMLQTSFDGPICILRPSLLYGANDPHNGYGPNMFRRKAAAGEDIVLFGEGEERHIVHVARQGMQKLNRGNVAWRELAICGMVVHWRTLQDGGIQGVGGGKHGLCGGQ